MSDEALIHDWNEAGRVAHVFPKPFELHDETLRDGIQNPSVVDPGVGDKLEILHLLNEMGVNSTDLGLPGAGARAFEDVLRLCKEIAKEKLQIRAACAGRTLEADIAPMVDISQRAGIPVEVMTFIGSSPIRQYAEGWTNDKIIDLSVKAIAFAHREGLPVTFVTEDTTRSRPDFLRDLFKAAMDAGANRLCLCDTVGHVTPDGVRNLIEFTRSVIDEHGCPEVKIDWHGHNDRGLALVNSIFALEYGADRVHGCVLGIGERVGNAPLDLILINLKLLGALEHSDLSQLAALARKVSNATRFPIPISYPVVGDDAFRTATGVHAAAIVKAHKKGDDWLADRVYSGVPAGMFGREQEICIGPMSGISNVSYWLERRGIEAKGTLLKAILTSAKASDHNLTDEEVLSVVARHDRREHDEA